MTVALKDYKGFAIDVTDSGEFEAWRTEVHESFDGKHVDKIEKVVTATTLGGLHKKVDALSKQKLGMTVWIDQYEGWTKGRVTSIRQEAERGYLTYRARVQLAGREWADADPRALVRDTPENAGMIAEITAMAREQKTLKKKEEAMRTKLVRHAIADFLGGPKEE